MLDKAQLLESLVSHCLQVNQVPQDPKTVELLKKIFIKAGKRMFTPELQAQLKELGIQSKPVAISHESVNQCALKAKDLVTLKNCANAFIAGLSSDLTALRAPLRAFAVLSHFPDHEHTGNSKGVSRSVCQVCGYSSGSLEGKYCEADNLQCLLVAGMHGRVNDAYQAAKTLEWFATLPALSPTTVQINRFNQLLQFIADSPGNGTVNSLAKDLSPFLGGDKYTRLYFLETLGYCGAFPTETGKPLLGKWINRKSIPEHPAKFNEAESPACFWSRQSGFDAAQFRKVFPSVPLPDSLDGPMS